MSKRKYKSTLRFILELARRKELSKLFTNFEKGYWEKVSNRVIELKIDKAIVELWRKNEIETVYCPGAGEDISTLLGVNAVNYYIADIRGDGREIYASILRYLEEKYKNRIEVLSKDFYSKKHRFEIEFRDREFGGETIRKITYYFRTDAAGAFPGKVDLVKYKGFLALTNNAPLEWKVKFLKNIPVGCYIEGPERLHFPQFLGLRQLIGQSGYYLKEYSYSKEQMNRAFRLEEFFEWDNFSALLLGENWEKKINECLEYIKQVSEKREFNPMN